MNNIKEERDLAIQFIKKLNGAKYWAGRRYRSECGRFLDQMFNKKIKKI